MPQRIIVIDDTPEIVQLYDDLLTDEGYAVVATFAGPPADVSEIEHHHPDLVLMDWLFGREVAGMRILDMLRGYPPTAAIPIIVCTAAHKSLGEAEGHLTECGVRILRKPFDIDDLVAMIRHVLA